MNILTNMETENWNENRCKVEIGALASKLIELGVPEVETTEILANAMAIQRRLTDIKIMGIFK